MDFREIWLMYERLQVRFLPIVTECLRDEDFIFIANIILEWIY